MSHTRVLFVTFAPDRPLEASSAPKNKGSTSYLPTATRAIEKH